MGGQGGLYKPLIIPLNPPLKKGDLKENPIRIYGDRMTLKSLSLDTPAPELLARLKNLFREWGLFDQPLTLTHRGQKYLVRCDAHSFTIYRLNPQCHVPPGVPGWPVCLVTPEMAVDETCPPHSEEDEFAAGLALLDWLDLIKKTLGK